MTRTSTAMPLKAHEVGQEEDGRPAHRDVAGRVEPARGADPEDPEEDAGQGGAPDAPQQPLPLAAGQEKHGQRGVGARDDQEDVGVIQPSQDAVHPGAPVAPVVQRADAEQQAGCQNVDAAGDPASGGVRQGGQEKAA